MLAFFSLGRLFGGQMFSFKAAFFAWSTALGKVILWTILGNDISLWLIGVVCVKLIRVVDHLLLHCDLANALWNAFFSQFDCFGLYHLD
jgi:hypothetical protein